MNQEFPQQSPGYPQQQKKGMSTGCLVALIIVGVLIILIVIAGIVCYMKRGDLVQYGAVTMTEEIKKVAAENPQPGVDTVRVNAAADAFLSHVEAAEEPDAEQLALYIQSIQHIRNDDVLDSLEAQQFVTAVTTAFPTLEDEVPPPMTEPPVDTMGAGAAPEDTVGTGE